MGKKFKKMNNADLDEYIDKNCPTGTGECSLALFEKQARTSLKNLHLTIAILILTVILVILSIITAIPTIAEYLKFLKIIKK
jgi:hypothetical protein